MASAECISCGSSSRMRQSLKSAIQRSSSYSTRGSGTTERNAELGITFHCSQTPVVQSVRVILKFLVCSAFIVLIRQLFPIGKALMESLANLFSKSPHLGGRLFARTSWRMRNAFLVVTHMRKGIIELRVIAFGLDCDIGHDFAGRGS